MTVINVQIHTTEGLVYTTTMDSSDIDSLTPEEQTAALTKLARELNARGLNVQNLNVDRIEITEDRWLATPVTANPSPAMFSGVARLFAPAGASACVYPPAEVPVRTDAAPAPSPDAGAPAEMSPPVPGGLNIVPQPNASPISFVLTPRPQVTVGSVTYDVYEGRTPDGSTAQFRRPRGQTNGWRWEVPGLGGRPSEWRDIPPAMISAGATPTPSTTVETRDRGRTVTLTPLTGDAHYIAAAGGQPRYEVFQTSGDPPVRYRHVVDVQGGLIDGPWQRGTLGRDGSYTYADVNPNAPRRGRGRSHRPAPARDPFAGRGRRF